MVGRDICASAMTGSGKTAAFTLPTLERLLYRPTRVPAIRVLILMPTRELAVQVHSMIEKLAQFTDIRCCLIVGGLSTEADRLLELGFNAEIQELVRMCSKRWQTAIFSDPSTQRPATLTEEVVRIRTREAHQEAVLLALCSKTFTSKAIIFSGTKLAAHRLKILFGLAGLKAAEIHGDLTQAQRLDALELFRKQEVDFLIATDVTARGFDIAGVQTVINFACPRLLDAYVHRVSRTARAGREGYAVTFVTDNDRSLLKAIAKKAVSKLKSRIVAEESINKWAKIVEQMEDQVAAIIREEKQEMALRKAEMEAAKAENLIQHRDEIFSRPERTWFITETEKKSIAKDMKATLHNGKNSGNQVVSAQQAEELKIKEKRKREREKNLARKKRRKLEAEREILEEGNESDDSEEDNKQSKQDNKGGIPLVYRRAKAAKAGIKALDSRHW